MNAPVRRPAVAGRFYPASPTVLSRDLDTYLGPPLEPEAEETAGVLACLVPHAGYMFSGHVAGAVYRRLPSRPIYVILGPNHFGRGVPLAVMTEAAWATPLGLAPPNPTLAQAIAKWCPLLQEDAVAHQAEHSLEVQVPFLQHRFRNFSIVPIAVGLGGYAELESLGQAVARSLRESPQPALIVASSDLNHYEPDDVTRVKDGYAIDAILSLDPAGLYRVIFEKNISMCGFGPAVAMLVAARELGAERVELVRYATSADAGGDKDSVVGYAGMLVFH